MMNKLKMNHAKNFISLLVAGLILLAIPQTAYAVSATPASGTIGVGQSTVIQLTASPGGANSDAVQIRLAATNLTITNYTAPTGNNWAPALTGSGCGAMFTASTVCVDLAKTSGFITSGESLGSITVEGISNGIGTLDRITDNGYLVGVSIEEQLGNAGTYNVGVGSGPGTTLPETAIFDSPGLSINLIVLGVAAIFAGIIFVAVPSLVNKQGTVS